MRLPVPSLPTEPVTDLANDLSWKYPLFRVSVVLVGLVLPQVVLFYPSLTGARVLLPLDILGLGDIYLPDTAAYRGLPVRNPVLSDEVFVFEPMRQFAAEELRQGRLPLWNPYSFAGAPLANFPFLSPLFLLTCLTPSPVALAWVQVLKAVIAGSGAYLFLRRVVGVRFWPAALGAWCYPLTGFYFLWLGYGLSQVTIWLPWTLWATDRAVRQPGGWGGPGLALCTALVIVSGQLDVAGQVLLASGFYALWCYYDAYGGRWLTVPALNGLAVAVAAWALGFLLAAPFLLPLLEYSATGARMQRRQQGAEERPPVGWSALPQMVVPKCYGSTETGTLQLFRGNLLESPAAAYTGLLATLFLAPLAWCDRQRRSLVLFLLGLTIFALGWSLNLPGFVQVLRGPVLRMLSHNRFVFVASFAVLTLAVLGLEQVCDRLPERRRWFVVPVAALALLAGWCGDRLVHYPPALTITLERLAQRAKESPDGHFEERAASMRRNFVIPMALGAGLAVTGLGFWGACWFGAGRRSWLVPALAVLWPAELLWFGHDLNPQCDPALYYPPVPALARLAGVPDRVLGLRCLPPQLNVVSRLREVRGYDAVDPLRMLELLDLARDAKQTAELRYAQTQWYVPHLADARPGELALPAVLNMLNVRYLIVRRPPADTVPVTFHEDDYWVLENKQALPRVFVPRRVEVVPGREDRLQALAADGFDPRAVAYVERPVDAPDRARGSGTIVDETPTRLTVTATMETPGLLVLADQWYPGWHATRDGTPLPIVRTNHALRGVVLPAGESTVVFTYRPDSLTRGFSGAALAAAGLLLWSALLGRQRSRT